MQRTVHRLGFGIRLAAACDGVLNSSVCWQTTHTHTGTGAEHYNGYHQALIGQIISTLIDLSIILRFIRNIFPKWVISSKAQPAVVACPLYNAVLMNQYVALLRGINVGGKNIIRMTDLKACFESLGFEDVSTYIQSGNVLFSAGKSGKVRLTSQIEAALSKTFDYESRVVVRSHKQMKDIVATAPKNFGSKPSTYRYDVLFLKEPLTASQAMKSVSTKEGVDQAFAGRGVLYFSRLISRATQSHLSRIISLPVYQSMTIRNWNTTTKLLNLMEAASE